MAYNNLVAVSCSDREEAFQRMRDFICKRNGTYDYSSNGIGWTLHDSSYATDEDNIASGDWFVIKSTGEDTKRDLYFQFIYSATANYIQVRGWLYWNNSTHAGVHAINSAVNNKYANNSSHTMWVYGDLDFVAILNTNSAGTTNYGCGFGALAGSQILDHTVATCSSSLSSGSNVSISVDSVPSDWAVGKKLVIRDNASIEHITILTLSGTTITANLTNSYSANSKLARDYIVTVNTTNNIASTWAVQIDHSGSLAGAMSLGVNTAVRPAIDPDPYEDDYGALPIYLGIGTNGCVGSIPHIYDGNSTVTDKAVYTTESSVDYRFFKLYNAGYWYIKEV